MSAPAPLRQTFTSPADLEGSRERIRDLFVAYPAISAVFDRVRGKLLIDAIILNKYINPQDYVDFNLARLLEIITKSECGEEVDEYIVSQVTELIDAMLLSQGRGINGDVKQEGILNCALGTIYGKGIGVVQNFVEAAKYWKIAADLGHKDAAYNYGVCCYTGEGVDKNLEQRFQVAFSGLKG